MTSEMMGRGACYPLKCASSSLLPPSPLPLRRTLRMAVSRPIDPNGWGLRFALHHPHALGLLGMHVDAHLSLRMCSGRSFRLRAILVGLLL